MQRSFTWGRKRGGGAVAAALLVGGTLLGTQLASAAGRLQARAVTFPSYTATPINTPTGIPTALNITNNGTVVGYVYPNTGPFFAFIRTGTTLTPLPGLGTGDTYSYAANNGGDAVGESRPTNSTPAHAVIWRSSDRQHPVDLSATLGVSDGESRALGINDAGDIVGVIGATGGSGSAFFLSHTGTLTIIGPGSAHSVNNAANPQVAVSQSTGVDSQSGIWDAQNGFQPAPIAHSFGIRVNDQGVLLGIAGSTAGSIPNSPFIWAVGQPSAHPLGFVGFGEGIDNAASPTVVGRDANGPVLWKEDTLTPLKSLLANPNQVDVDTATAINDTGKISATGFSGSWLFSPGSATHVDLQATVTADPATVASPTSTTTITVLIKNFGPDAATGVQVTPVINGVSTPAVAVPGSIASGATFPSSFQIKPADFGVTGGTFIFTANVTSDGIEPNPDTTHRNSGSTTVTINPAGPPPASAKAKTVKASRAVVAGDPIHVTVTLDKKTAAAMDGEVHFIVNSVNTALTIHFAANSSSASLDIPTTDFRAITSTISALISASAGGASAKPTSVPVSILPIQLDAAKFTVVAPSAQAPGGKVSVILNFTGDLPDAGVDVVFNGLFVNNKTVHVTPTDNVKSQAVAELSTSEVTGTVSGTMTASYNGKTIKSPKLTIKSATPPPALALADASITPSVISNSTAPASIKVSVTFNQALAKGQKVDVKLAITGPLPIPVNTKVSIVGVAGQATYVKTAADVTNFGQLLTQAPAGTYTVVASYGTGSKTLQFTIQ